jgi:hypothetical protein
MEIYKDMVEKLKFHKNNIINSFIKKNYYPSNDEINAKLALVDSRLALFESYISKPGSYMNIKELNYCFEMIAKDIEILYKVLESILIEDFSALNVHIEAALTELESKADYYRKRCTEEIHSTTLGTTVFFQANNWKIREENEMNIIDLGTIKLIEGMEISCFAEINDVEDKDVVFQFDNNDAEKSFLALPYNYNNNSYKVPGVLGINQYDLQMPVTSIVDDYIPIKYEINFENKYKIAGAIGGMQVTLKRTGETFLYKFANIDNAFVAEEDCFVEFYVLDGNTNPNATMEYSFTEAPISTNFSLQNGEIPLNKDAVKISIECQKGLGMFFALAAGTVYASLEDAIIVNKNTLIYKGNWDIRDFVLREYVRTNTSSYRVKVFVKTKDDIVGNIESIYIKEVTS